MIITVPILILILILIILIIIIIIITGIIIVIITNLPQQLWAPQPQHQTRLIFCEYLQPSEASAMQSEPLADRSLAMKFLTKIEKFLLFYAFDFIRKCTP
jgi:hypothetical protein